MYIRILESLRLASVRRIAPQVRFDSSKARCDLGTLQAVFTHRYDVLARFARSVRQTALDELRGISADTANMRYRRARAAVKHWTLASVFSLTLPRSLWQTAALRAKAAREDGPFRAITLDADVDLDVCGYLAPAAVGLVEAGVICSTPASL